MRAATAGTVAPSHPLLKLGKLTKSLKCFANKLKVCSFKASAGRQAGSDAAALVCKVRLGLRKSSPFTSFSLTFGMLTIKFEMLFQFRKVKSHRCRDSSPPHPLLKLGKLTIKFEMLCKKTKSAVSELRRGDARGLCALRGMRHVSLAAVERQVLSGYGRLDCERGRNSERVGRGGEPCGGCAAREHCSG